MLGLGVRTEIAVRLRRLDRSGPKAVAIEHLERIVNLGQTWMGVKDGLAVLPLATELGVALFGVRFLAPTNDGPVEQLQVWGGPSSAPPPLPMAVATEWTCRPLSDLVKLEGALLATKSRPAREFAAG